MQNNIINGLVITKMSHYSGVSRSLSLAKPILEKKDMILHFVAPTKLVNFLISILNLIIFSKIDFIIINSIGATFFSKSYYLSKLAIYFNIPVFIYWHEMEYSFKKYEKIKPKKVRLTNKFAKLKELKHIACSNICAEYIKSRYEISSVFPAINCADLKVKFDIDEIISKRRKCVVNIGTIQEQKGVDLFIDTAILVCKSDPEVEFIWIGSGDYKKFGYNKVTNENLEHRIKFIGSLRDPVEFLIKCQIFFCSSREESFSLTTAEAMSLACNIVTFESGGPIEVSGDTGHVIKNFDVRLAAEKIIDLLSLPKADVINHKARERYLKLYTPEIYSNNLDTFIRSSLKHG